MQKPSRQLGSQGAMFTMNLVGIPISPSYPRRTNGAVTNLSIAPLKLFAPAQLREIHDLSPCQLPASDTSADKKSHPAKDGLGATTHDNPFGYLLLEYLLKRRSPS